jgi:uncharacterized protein (TIGR03083 family)
MRSYVNKYIELVSALADELDSFAQVLKSLGADEWSRPTLLAPVDLAPHWTVLELAGHLGYAMNMIDTLLSKASAPPPALDRVSFYDQPKGLLAPLAYRTAADVAADMTSAEMLDYCLTNFSNAPAKARLAEPTFVGWTVIGTIQIDEFIATRVVEAVIHGLDLAQALNRSATPSDAAVECAANVLDSLNVRHQAHSRPKSLSEDWLGVQVASGRRHHDDFPVPLLN